MWIIGAAGRTCAGYLIFFRDALYYMSYRGLNDFGGTYEIAPQFLRSYNVKLRSKFYVVGGKGLGPRTNPFGIIRGRPITLWALRDSDPRPHRCKRCALTNCAKCPSHCLPRSVPLAAGLLLVRERGLEPPRP